MLKISCRIRICNKYRSKFKIMYHSNKFNSKTKRGGILIHGSKVKVIIGKVVVSMEDLIRTRKVTIKKVTLKVSKINKFNSNQVHRHNI